MSLPFDRKELAEMVERKYVNVQKHPKHDLFIYNYGPKTQYEKNWNSVTLNCRGLILDSNGDTVSRPFSKFFNLHEHKPEEIPNLGFEVFEKMDGSMGILYWFEDKPFIATRGSFDSNQAVRATQILYDRYSHTFGELDRSKTYIYEIIYPENRIVCDYGKMEDLILLSVIDNHTGKDCELPEIGFPLVKRYDGVSQLNRLTETQSDRREGYVVRFSNGFRVKIKFDEYCRLHRIITQVSNKTVWEYLSMKKDFNEMLDRVPDEFYGWVRTTKRKLFAEYAAIEREANEYFRPFDDRREAADYFLKHRLSHILFAMLDGKDYNHIIWKMVKPKYEKPFSSNGE